MLLKRNLHTLILFFIVGLNCSKTFIVKAQELKYIPTQEQSAESSIVGLNSSETITIEGEEFNLNQIVQDEPIITVKVHELSSHQIQKQPTESSIVELNSLETITDEGEEFNLDEVVQDESTITVKINELSYNQIKAQFSEPSIVGLNSLEIFTDKEQMFNLDEIVQDELTFKVKIHELSSSQIREKLIALDEQATVKLPPENINPNANPLLFPTKPREVKIDNELSLTLEQAIELALKNNKDLQVSRLELEKSEASLKSALAEQLPTLDGNLEFNQRADDTGFAQGDNFSRDRRLLTGQIEVGYDLYTGGRRGANITRSRRQVYLSKLDVERLVENTRFETTTNYYDLQNADAQVAIAQAAVEDFSQTLRDAELLEQAGLGTRFDVLQAQVDLANANQALTRAIAEQRIGRKTLAQTLSLGQKVEITAADEITESGKWAFSLEESIVKAYKNRVELEQFLVQKEINEENKKIALADIKPQISLFANYNFNGTIQDSFENNEGYADGYNVGARLRWRLFDGGKAFANEEEADRDIDIDETNFANQRNEIRLQVENAYYQMIANQENIGTTEQAVITATESLRLARLRFQAGVGTQTDVINAQRSLTESRGNFLQAIIGYNKSLNELQRAVSNLPDNRLFELR